MEIVYVLVLWLGVQVGGVPSASLSTVEGFKTYNDCANALAQIKRHPDGKYINGTCIPK